MEEEEEKKQVVCLRAADSTANSIHNSGNGFFSVTFYILIETHVMDFYSHDQNVIIYFFQMK